MTREEAKRVIDNILTEKLHFDVTKLTDQQKGESLLSPQYGFMAIDLFVLYMELEKELNVHFAQEDVIEKRFDVYNNIVDCIMEKKKG